MVGMPACAKAVVESVLVLAIPTHFRSSFGHNYLRIHTAPKLRDYTFGTLAIA